MDPIGYTNPRGGIPNSSTVGCRPPGSYGRRMALAATALAKATAATGPPKKAILFAGSFGSWEGKWGSNKKVFFFRGNIKSNSLFFFTNLELIFNMMWWCVYFFKLLKIACDLACWSFLADPKIKFQGHRWNNLPKTKLGFGSWFYLSSTMCYTCHLSINSHVWYTLYCHQVASFISNTMAMV